MKCLLFYAILFCAALGFAPAVFAQIPPDCGGPPSQVPPAESCMEACAYCDFNGLQNTTEGFKANAAPPGFCGVIQNDQWIGFVAASAAPTFTLTPSNCLNGNGLEFALYESCAAPPLVCKPGQAGGGTTPLSISASNLTVGRHYYLLIDGYAGDKCNFNLTVSPSSPPPPMGSISPIQGPTTVCPSATVNYEVPQVTGAGFYTWRSPVPGVRFNGQPSPVTVLAPEGRKVQVSFPANLSGNVEMCVEVGNACNNGAMRCRTISVQPIPPTNLPTIVVCFEDGPVIPQTIVLKSWLGCDSVVKQPVINKPPIQVNIGPRYICKGDSIVVCGKVFKDAGPIQEVCQSYQGCDSLVVGSLTVLETAFQTAPYKPLLNCNTPELTLSVSTPLPNNVGVIWRSAQGLVLGSGKTLKVTQPGIYKVTATASLGGKSCVTVKEIKVSANFTQPAPLKTAKSGSLAAGGSVTLKAYSPTPDLLYQWIGPQGFISVSQIVQVTVPGTYKVTATHPLSGCMVMGTVEVL